MPIDDTADELIAKFACLKIRLEKIEEYIMEEDYVGAAFGTASVINSLDSLGEALAIIIRVTEGDAGIAKLFTRIIEDSTKRKGNK